MHNIIVVGIFQLIRLLQAAFFRHRSQPLLSFITFLLIQQLLFLVLHLTTLVNDSSLGDDAKFFLARVCIASKLLMLHAWLCGAMSSHLSRPIPVLSCCMGATRGKLRNHSRTAVQELLIFFDTSRLLFERLE